MLAPAPPPLLLRRRNMYRGTPRAFALDPKGLAWAQQLLGVEEVKGWPLSFKVGCVSGPRMIPACSLRIAQRSACRERLKGARVVSASGRKLASEGCGLVAPGTSFAIVT